MRGSKVLAGTVYRSSTWLHERVVVAQGTRNRVWPGNLYFLRYHLEMVLSHIKMFFNVYPDCFSTSTFKMPPDELSVSAPTPYFFGAIKRKGRL